MLRKIAIAAGTLGLCAIGTFIVAGRHLGELSGLVRATADTTVDRVENQFPVEIHDRKMDHELRHARQELIDRQVQLNLSRNQIDQLRDEVAKLTASVARRQRLLAEAYPLLKAAIDGQQTAVRFASTDFTMPDFDGEIDDLMTQQDRETRQLQVKRDGLARLEKSLHDGEQAIAEMRHGLETTEQEVAILKSRREQAQIESSTLDMLTSVTANQQTSGASIGQDVERLKANVEQIEARNEARRDTASVNDRQPRNQISRSWNRLEELKSYHDSFEAQQPPAAQAEKDAEPQVEDAQEVVAALPETAIN
ncbi:MAG: hypothetical protein O3C40_06075 [Planctomycetota bacterium]|nr:hypothetical protein [Planctomycetota bacterium]